MQQLTGNKGEWSEVYVLFKLLGDRRVYAGDKDLNRIANLFYPILKIIRDEQDPQVEYLVDKDLILVESDGTELGRIKVSEFLNEATKLLAIIRKNSGTFSAPSIQKFMDEIHCRGLKAKASDKADIRIVIHDLRTGMSPLLGFSIKSQLGSPSTLLNAGRTTNFIYKIIGCPLSSDIIESINGIVGRTKIRDRISAIINNGCHLEYYTMENSTFQNNLILIDSLMPRIVASVLNESYCTGETNIHKLVDKITKENPIGYSDVSTYPYYEHKVKQMLVDIALGMTPAKPWNGIYDATGGYLVVKKDGDVVCYHFYERNHFEDYLYCNTKLESASTERYSYAKIYEENGERFIKLNLQIRFY